MMNKVRSADNISWAILIFLSFVWGCSFILIKKSLISFSPTQLSSLRIGISALAYSPFVLYFRKEIDWSKWYKFLAVGLTGSGIPAFLFFFAQTKISSSVAGLLNSLTPIWTLIIGIFIFRLKFNNYKLFGVVLGFIGASSLVILAPQHGVNSNPWFGLLIVLATICYAASVNMVQAFFKNTKPIIISSVSFSLMGPPFLIYLYFSDFGEILVSKPGAIYSFGAVTILALFGTVLSSYLFYNLVQRTNAVFGSTVTYLMPIMAMYWGFLDGETISWHHFAGMATILLGVFFTKKEVS